MAPLGACLLLMAIIASFVCFSVATRALFRWASGHHGKTKAKGALGEGLGRKMRSLPVVRERVERAERRKREALLKRQMPDALRLLCIALDAGSSLVKALAYAAENVDEPLASELKRTVWDLEAGQGFDEAMSHLRERTGGSEFSYLAVAMEIQHQSGGSLSDVLQTISGSLRKSAELGESLRTQTTQGRLSARVVAAIPVAIVLLFSLFSPGYLASFVSSPLGAVLLVLAVALELVGVFWVRKSLDVDLSAHVGGGAA